MSPSEKRIEADRRYKEKYKALVATLIKTVNKLRKEVDAQKADDQVNIKFINMQNEIDELHAKVSCLEECEDLRDKQMKVLETVINKQIKFIENHVN